MRATLFILLILGTFISTKGQETSSKSKIGINAGFYQDLSYFGQFDKASTKIKGIKYSAGFRADYTFFQKFNLQLGIEYLHDKENRTEMNGGLNIFTQTGEIAVAEETKILIIPLWLGMDFFTREKFRLAGNIGIDNHMYKKKITHTPISFSEPPVTDTKKDISDIYGTFSLSARYLITDRLFIDILPFYKLDFYKDFNIENYHTGCIFGIGYRW